MKLLKDLVSDLFSRALSEIAGNAVEARIEYAREEKFGDYACTSALDQRVRESCGIKNPRELAERVIQNLRKAHIEVASTVAGESKNSESQKLKLSGEQCFSDISIAGPGFINVTLSNDFLLLLLGQTLQSGANYGKSESKDKRNIIFEFVSANPTGPLNVVSARAAALGDARRAARRDAVGGGARRGR